MTIDKKAEELARDLYILFYEERTDEAEKLIAAILRQERENAAERADQAILEDADPLGLVCVTNETHERQIKIRAAILGEEA